MVINDNDCSPKPSTLLVGHAVQLFGLLHFKSTPEKDSKKVVVTITLATICKIWPICILETVWLQVKWPMEPQSQLCGGPKSDSLDHRKKRKKRLLMTTWNGKHDEL
jgi:hypothetical protein